MIGLFPQNSRERDLIFSNNNTIPTFLFILGIFLFPSPSLFFFFRNRIFPFKEKLKKCQKFKIYIYSMKEIKRAKRGKQRGRTTGKPILALGWAFWK